MSLSPVRCLNWVEEMDTLLTLGSWTLPRRCSHQSLLSTLSFVAKYKYARFPHVHVLFFIINTSKIVHSVIACMFACMCTSVSLCQINVIEALDWFINYFIRVDEL